MKERERSDKGGSELENLSTIARPSEKQGTSKCGREKRNRKFSGYRAREKWRERGSWKGVQILEVELHLQHLEMCSLQLSLLYHATYPLLFPLLEATDLTFLEVSIPDLI